MSKVYGYMDLTDFRYELGNAAGGNTIHPSIKDLEEYCPCVETCGIVKVSIKQEEVIREDKFGLHEEKWNKEAWIKYYEERVKVAQERVDYFKLRLEEAKNDII